MNDADFATQQERILALGNTWACLVGLTHWEIKYVFHRELIPTFDPDTTMACSTDWRYMAATISVNCAECVDLVDEKLEWIFVHELAHILVNEMRVDGVDEDLGHEERVCSMLAYALQATRGSYSSVSLKQGLQDSGEGADNA